MTREERQKQLDEEFKKNGGFQSIDGEPRKIFLCASCCRLCRHYHGDDYCTCNAYPNGIPDKFALRVGENTPQIHKQIEQDQIGDYIFSLSNSLM
ncbi:MAG: hypothetical protein IKA19_09665 [Muribaculaceae bacterium]|nr:hypothetical protein [Muribaculaceae bacterium]MBR1964944.1 hypothetical protein [Muribaculaceae bacterium]